MLKATIPAPFRPAKFRSHLAAGVLMAFWTLTAAGCASRQAPRSDLQNVPQGSTLDVQRLYQGMGLIAGSGSVPFVGSISFLRAPNSDSTLVLVALSLPSRALAFTREGDRYVAAYNARVEVRQDGTPVRSIEARETVRVPTYRETSRTDESIIWQQFLTLAPGNYLLQVGIRDDAGIRTSTEEVNINVPRFNGRVLSTPIPVYEAIPRTTLDSLPRILARPRSSVFFGQDSIMPVYIEASGPDAPSSVNVVLTGDDNVTLWHTEASLEGDGSVHNTTVAIPVSRMGIGVTTLRMSAPGSKDTTFTRILVSLGDDLPIATFDEMITYLRWFASGERLMALRAASPEQRGEAWANFLNATDPYPGTPENEALRDYFARLRAANQRFRDDGPVGWQSDRGTAYVALGDPDEIYDSNATDPSARVRQQVWVYREHRLDLVFIDQSGFGRWKLTAAGMADLQNAIRRKLAQQ